MAWRSPERGDVVVFTYPCDREKDYIKRVVAVAGDRVEVRCNRLFINHEAVPRELVEEPCRYWDFDEDGKKGFDGDDYRTRHGRARVPRSHQCDEHESSSWGSCLCSRYLEGYEERTYDTIYSPEQPKLENNRGFLDFPTKNNEWGKVTRGGEDFLQPKCDKPGRYERTSQQVRAAEGRMEHKIRESGNRACRQRAQYVVPPGHVFVMGDNREKSADSRKWGPVPVDDVKGKALFIWWSSKPEFAGGYEWSRIGKLVH